jgi:hypothetical protein
MGTARRTWCTLPSIRPRITDNDDSRTHTHTMRGTGTVRLNPETLNTHAHARTRTRTPAKPCPPPQARPAPTRRRPTLAPWRPRACTSRSSAPRSAAPASMDGMHGVYGVCGMAGCCCCCGTQTRSQAPSSNLTQGIRALLLRHACDWLSPQQRVGALPSTTGGAVCAGEGCAVASEEERKNAHQNAKIGAHATPCRNHTVWNCRSSRRALWPSRHTTSRTYDLL